jgi:hypothetical protein
MIEKGIIANQSLNLFVLLFSLLLLVFLRVNPIYANPD